MLLMDVKGNLEACLKAFEEICVESPEMASQWPEVEEAFGIAIRAVDKQMEIVDMLNDMTADGDNENSRDTVTFKSVFNILDGFYVFGEGTNEQ